MQCLTTLLNIIFRIHFTVINFEIKNRNELFVLKKKMTRLNLAGSPHSLCNDLISDIKMKFKIKIS